MFDMDKAMEWQRVQVEEMNEKAAVGAQCYICGEDDGDDDLWEWDIGDGLGTVRMLCRPCFRMKMW